MAQTQANCSSELKASAGDYLWRNPEYDHVHRRLLSLPNIPEERIEQAWNSLKAWGKQVFERSGKQLPAPWVFANEENIIEFEWHEPHRQFFLRLDSGATVHYVKLEQIEGREIEVEEVMPLTEVPEALVWLVESGC